MRINEEVFFKNLDDAAGRLVRAIALGLVAIAAFNFVVEVADLYLSDQIVVVRWQLPFLIGFAVSSLLLVLWCFLLLLAASYSFRAAIVDGMNIKGGSAFVWICVQMSFFLFSLVCSTAINILVGPTIQSWFSQ